MAQDVVQDIPIRRDRRLPQLHFEAASAATIIATDASGLAASAITAAPTGGLVTSGGIHGVDRPGDLPTRHDRVPVRVLHAGLSDLAVLGSQRHQSVRLRARVLYPCWPL